MAVNLAALVRQPEDVTLTIGRTVACRPITGAGAEVLERFDRTPREMPTSTDLRQIVAHHLPDLEADDLARLGMEEMLYVLVHAAGNDLTPAIEALQAEIAVGNGAAPARTAARRGRGSR